MSKSSKTLKPTEIEDLYKAQLQAASMRRLQWVQWMRETYSFAMAVRMSRFLGFSSPSLPFYRRMRDEGKRLRTIRAAHLAEVAASKPIHWGIMKDIEQLT